MEPIAFLIREKSEVLLAPWSDRDLEAVTEQIKVLAQEALLNEAWQVVKMSNYMILLLPHEEQI
ncbi:MAG: hypothetical protein Kow00121_52170 [Elainellaceae cyanobacterium]